MATVSDVRTTRRSRRTEILEARPINRDGFVEEWPEVGLIAMESPHDPKPSIRVEGGTIVEMDGKSRAEFDFIEHLYANQTPICSFAVPRALVTEMQLRLVVTSWQRYRRRPRLVDVCSPGRTDGRRDHRRERRR